ncbi:hypothetical protein SD960_04555 [Flavobacterium sp. MMLR14_040]|nr:hypothetical protein [Flavobacterium sp. MMLR14_040]MDW8849353.1 hypothetical protein [Flavobacterium sp. MMLR14_040]
MFILNFSNYSQEVKKH